MSTAPRPQTSPSTTSPPNGSRRQPSGFTGHDVGVAHEQQRRRGRVAALDPRDEVLPPGLRLVALEVEAAAAEVPASRSALRISTPDSGVPSLTHSLRIRCCEQRRRFRR